MPKTLLLADDSVTIQKVVGISLANEDIKLVSVENGDDAVSKAQEIRPDIVLADIVMPGKNGYEVCEAIKGDAALGKTPVLLLTGTFEAFDAERARQAGADGHITKPFEAQALVDQVNQLLAKSAHASDEAARAATSAAGQSAAPSPAASSADMGAHGEGGDAFDFFEDGGGDGESSWPTASPADAGIDLMSDAPPARGGQAEETMLLDPSQPSGDPEFDAAVEAAAFDAPAMRPLGGPEDSGFDLETADLSMASTVPEVSVTPAAMSFSDTEPPEAAPATPSDPLLDFDPGLEPSPPAAATPAPAATAPSGEATVIDPVLVQSFDEPTPEETAVEDTDPVRVQAPADSDTTAPVAPVAPASSGAPEVPPALQQHVHATLEKIAWEAFSDLSEQVVKLALDRVEKIAWEVVPQMAEAAIREELAKMKDDGGDEG